ncbi:MAG: aminotransferase class IV, partial [Lapillicoccus sp.]
GLLLGITRGLLLEWGRAAGVEMRETVLPLDVLAGADEVFLTSSIKDVFPVHAVDDRELAPGPVTARLAQVFVSRAAEDLDP